VIWLSWRQFRAQAATGGAAAVMVALVLALTGPRLADLAGPGVSIYDLLSRTDRNLFFAGVVVLAVAPALAGVFWGAPLVARELESGTHRLVWTQSVTRTRWLTTRLAVVVAGAVVVVGLVTLAVTWWSDPLDGAVSSGRGGLPSRLTPVSFAMRGLVPVGYAVFAVVLGATVGAVLRRPLPAMAVTLALYVAVQVAVPTWVRPHLASPIRTDFTFTRARIDSITLRQPAGPVTITLSTGRRDDWVLSNQTVDPSGRSTALPAWMASCLPPPPGQAGGVTGPRTGQAPSIDSCLARLAAEGYHQRIVYQPADRFWTLQWRETALFLALAGLLAAACFWWTRT
jgi:hypothetical protein